ncbi:MAG: DUF3267 domain-containing protein [Ruminococcus sp.]|nr:DUF3267 domain-containing protein [Ruminococcus sp.]
MPKIVWEGNKKEWGLPHNGEPLHENAVRINTADNVFRDSIPYGIPPMLICFLTVFLKAFLNKEPPIDPLFILPALIIGMIVALPLHELMHAICYPKKAEVWVGLCLRKVAAYAISFCPITRRRYVLMSLAPSLLGILPLIAFILIPVSYKPSLTFCIVSAFTGLISPCPDYMDVLAVMRQTNKNDMIQAANDGLYKF